MKWEKSNDPEEGRRFRYLGLKQLIDFVSLVFDLSRDVFC